MSAGPAAWQKIIPQRLWPAVEHVRNSFETNKWKVSGISQKLCYAALYPDTCQLTSLSPYKVEAGTGHDARTGSSESRRRVPETAEPRDARNWFCDQLRPIRSTRVHASGDATLSQEHARSLR